MRVGTLQRTQRGDNGFTLIELLLAVVILGIITIPLSNVVIDFLGYTDATTGRLIESHDVQITSAYWTPDVASVGVRSTTSPFGLTQSVQAGVEYNSGLYPCGSPETPEKPETPKAIVRLAWDDYSTPGGSGSVVRVAYVAQAAPGETTVTELHRIRCEGSAADPAVFTVSDIALAHDLDPNNLPTATCSIASVLQDCNATAPPTTVTLRLTLKDAKNLDAAYQIDLTGQRRQS